MFTQLLNVPGTPATEGFKVLLRQCFSKSQTPDPTNQKMFQKFKTVACNVAATGKCCILMRLTTIPPRLLCDLPLASRSRGKHSGPDWPPLAWNHSEVHFLGGFAPINDAHQAGST
ncbi:predicted protein [Histoplasma capsulatum var. duboisii H88]|uniref:Predicted protein n=1 Tax=Ajellomyces capsulatus (strain H88) TaxID=544711 RepID=F0UKV5_AJEC8|nr:predicted protein [Histoplasma capsulatum var. duboisii H88]